MQHSDEAAFLAAIAAGDDTARLVFADWLQERGDPRAPWIRDAEIWPFMAPDATDPMPRLLDPMSAWEVYERTRLLARLGVCAVPALVAALGDKDRRVSNCAARALERLGSSAVDAVPDLIELLSNPEPDQRALAVSILSEIGPGAAAAVPALIGALRDQDWGVRCRTAGALPSVSVIDTPRVVPALIEALRDTDGNVRAAAAGTLGKMARHYDIEGAVPALIQTLRDEDADALCSAAWALGEIKERAEESVPALARVLRDGEERIRGAAADALREFGGEGMLALVDALRDDAEHIRATAPSSFEGLRTSAALAVEQLTNAIRWEFHPSRTFQEREAEALALIGPYLLPRLIAALQVTPGGDWVQWAALALAKFGPGAVEALPALIALSDVPEDGVRMAVRHAIRNIRLS